MKLKKPLEQKLTPQKFQALKISKKGVNSILNVRKYKFECLCLWLGYAGTTNKLQIFLNIKKGPT